MDLLDTKQGAKERLICPYFGMLSPNNNMGQRIHVGLFVAVIPVEWVHIWATMGCPRMPLALSFGF